MSYTDASLSCYFWKFQGHMFGAPGRSETSKRSSMLMALVDRKNDRKPFAVRAGLK